MFLGLRVILQKSHQLTIPLRLTLDSGCRTQQSSSCVWGSGAGGNRQGEGEVCRGQQGPGGNLGPSHSMYRILEIARKRAWAEGTGTVQAREGGEWGRGVGCMGEGTCPPCVGAEGKGACWDGPGLRELGRGWLLSSGVGPWPGGGPERCRVLGRARLLGRTDWWGPGGLH